LLVTTPPSTTPRVVVVVPTYNEAANVRLLIHELLGLRCRPDVLVVDDNSPDGTADLVAAIGAADRRIMVHRRPGKQGLGAAYIDGFQRVLDMDRYDVVVQMDADFSHAPLDVDRLVAATSDADVVIGSRYVADGGVQGWPIHRRWLSRGGNRYARLWLRLPVRDLTGGFKAWRATTLAKVDLGSVRSDGYAFQVETTTRALAAGARVVEVPIRFVNREAGTSKMTTRIAIEALRVIPSLRQIRS
jgi:dolichol-phosphate mannosyltransferase